MSWLWFVFGSAMGSTANALLYRLPRNIAWSKGRSRCDSCGHELQVVDLIPIFSYLWLRGKCRYCHSPIGIRDLGVEIFMGTVFLMFMRHGWSVENLMLAGIAWVTSIIFLMDWETKLVSEYLVVVWVALVTVINFYQGRFELWGVGLGVGLIGGIWAVTRGKGMGFGDVEIAAVMGWWLGLPRMAIALWLAFVVGGIVGGWQVVSKKSSLKSEIAFGPFLLLGTWIGWFGGDVILAWLSSYGF